PCKQGHAREVTAIDQIGNDNRRRGTYSTNHEGATRYDLHQPISAGELLGVRIREHAAKKRPLFAHDARVVILPVERAQQLSPQINVELVGSLEVFGQYEDLQ